MVGDFARRLMLGARGLLDLVLARVRIVGHMAHVGHVHHVLDPIAVELERALERVAEEIRTQVAEMRGQIDGRPAGVHAHVGRMLRLELFDAAAERIIDVERLHTSKIAA